MHAKLVSTLAIPIIASGVLLAVPADAKSTHTKKTAKFVISALHVRGHASVDVADADGNVRVRVQVKDHSRAFDPASVKLVVLAKETGEPTDTFTVVARRVGKSKVVTNWHANVTVPMGAVAPGEQVEYCVAVVKAVPDSPAALPVLETARGLAGRDCFTVVNSTVL